MPDPLRKTVSGTQAACLLSLSPYGTPWTVYQYLAAGARGPDLDDFRVRLGLKLQRPILELVAEDLRLEVVDNGTDEYTRHPSEPVGCTRDGLVICPSRGKGLVQVKNVAADQAMAWKDGLAPPHVEIQLQHEMLAEQAQWGIIAALIGGGELLLLERRPSPKWQGRILKAARSMVALVAAGTPPPAFGHEAEAELLAELYPNKVPKKALDSEDPRLVEAAENYRMAAAKESEAKKAKAQARTLLAVAIEDAEYLFLPSHRVQQTVAANGVVSIKVKDRT